MKTKRFYLAEHIDEDIHSRTYGQKVVRTVTSEGYSRGLAVDRWMMVFAIDMVEARAKFARGEGSRSTA